jgi:Protein of unknown function (DUF3574)
MRLAIAGALSACLFILPGCAGMRAGCRASEEAALIDSLYFGTTRASGTVTTEEWRQFLAQFITPRFPAGLTAWEAAGQWRNSAGEIQQEQSHVLHLVHADTPENERAINDVIAAYKTSFQQDAVLRVRSPTCISF